MRILAIETSCDETSIALVEAHLDCAPARQATGDLNAPKFQVLKNIVHSQIEIHKEWGGVVPNLAKREHLKNLPILFKEIGTEEFDLIAVTVGPGLEPALWTGVTFAVELGQKLNKPVIGANHLEAHLYSFLLTSTPPTVIPGLTRDPILDFPAIGLLVSGGHTILALFNSLTEFEKLGETRDDAVGEVFDKVARMLNRPYPGGPEIEAFAKDGDPKAFDLPRPMINEFGYEFSFSGLKTSVLYLLRDQGYYNADGLKPTSESKKDIPLKLVQDLSASFQSAVIDVLVKKTMRATNEFGAMSVFLGGGVAANQALRQALKEACERNGLQFVCPSMEFNTDNAAMIAVAGYISHLTGRSYPLIADSNLSL
ncbi:MAG: tRNA (adenosine(37)-N6)-threonylcarbamoyltransferase complex transferase subunit TsaD [Candidatus Harrisonbacteria bacterium CG10_big_fil_rev_8_21_14_0_10_45_28]|uniref:tRNA N6-adenosine threonylcarbamoyltransferase n=1 Tax=Candidatus Harrisonbacteria bacterium CG10_big_fil_rev_8_21_14_0_10_45_28 TaxID=1974586 RepID=A0A2H0UPQ3_9BACT|nr:MAG: tRNA (adenosine(37)-N6)-threonylcarbamoyltransferase complex transferase subunit TsaD [Candidatus Harrisonbacteria bacterium CG10_big_fil_rev_8_21_14_0_10_45_28]